MKRAILLLAAVAIAAICLAKCAMFTENTVLSSNGKYKLHLKGTGDFELYFKGRKGFRQISGGKIALKGHHPKITLLDSGDRFIVADTYDGIGIYSARGKTIRFRKPEDVLSKDELEQRPGKWACHEEGTWMRAMEVKSDTVLVTLYTENKFQLRLY